MIFSLCFGMSNKKNKQPKTMLTLNTCIAMQQQDPQRKQVQQQALICLLYTTMTNQLTEFVRNAIVVQNPIIAFATVYVIFRKVK